VHSSYGRRLADAPADGRRVLIGLAVCRFFCGNPDCPKKTFAEQVDGLTARRARRTPPLARALTAIALALADRAGSRLAVLLDLLASRSSLLRLIIGPASRADARQSYLASPLGHRTSGSSGPGSGPP
jgi:hypothetical protein